MLSNFQVLIVMGILLVLLIGFVALPASKKIVRKSYIDATPENVYNLLVSTEGFQTFNPYKDSDSNLKIMPFGPATVVGAGFKFNGKEGTQTIVDLKENEFVIMEIDLGSMGKPKQTLFLSAKDKGTLVTWQVEMTFGVNPIGRLFGLFADGVLGKTYELGLTKMSSALLFTK